MPETTENLLKTEKFKINALNLLGLITLLQNIPPDSLEKVDDNPFKTITMRRCVVNSLKESNKILQDKLIKMNELKVETGKEYQKLSEEAELIIELQLKEVKKKELSGKITKEKVIEKTKDIEENKKIELKKINDDLIAKLIKKVEEEIGIILMINENRGETIRFAKEEDNKKRVEIELQVAPHNQLDFVRRNFEKFSLKMLVNEEIILAIGDALKFTS